MIGDAAHCCPPTLAQGAALALEDAAVLAELLLAPRPGQPALWTAVHSPPLPAGPEPSWTLPTSSPSWLIDHVQGDVPALMRQLAELVSKPA